MNNWHILFAILATWRLTDLLIQDVIFEPIRRRFKFQFWKCGRCVSVWAGGFCLAAFLYFPWINWVLAFSELFLLSRFIVDRVNQSSWTKSLTDQNKMLREQLEQARQRAVTDTTTIASLRQRVDQAAADISSVLKRNGR